ncbi:hypothetical protein QBK99_14065 [Corticibacterium sp. UT-5YL-CI-8]|nr:hypothetical protein [Tianweitania sp. UT-5YL-CI-8]
MKVLASACRFLLAAMLAGTSSQALADEACAVCDKEIVTNAELASCFLDRYDEFAKRAGNAVVVDLSACEQARGVIEPLKSLVAPSGPDTALPEEPNVTFMVSRTQLDCLRKKLQEPGLKLDPSLRIALGSCG